MKTNASLLKKLTMSTLLITASSVSMLSHGAVTLLVDDHIKVTAINGQEIQQSAFQPLMKSFTLEPGQHAITAKYDRLYNLTRDEHDYLRSGNVSVTAELADNQTYRLTMPNQPEKYAAAKEYAKRPTLAVQQNNTVVASQQGVAGNEGGLLSGLGKALGGVFGGADDAELQNQRAIAALGQPTASTVNTGAVTTVKQTTSAASSTNNLDQFMQIWLQATPAEREKMRQWMQK
ncbi:DUF2057 family protein [Psychrobacter sp. ANT_WB68]|uniref:DUF2057 family protein n=1 Tax=Psychrobacter sp. ANT_WB68 TaxID=2597355 RepID=UPI0011F1EB1C|nr:DUF2057 family protein [Psychrobacter sp. ANT_WB68]KAA0915301.1 DUF2057 domain-containing protein [Psychrobacter sp. ANT_WB68]